MIKGCSKRMIILKDTGSDFFEEAYFVLKTAKDTCKIATEKDFIAEANRIVSEAGNAKIKDCTGNRSDKKRAFLYGMLAGISLCVIAFLFFRYLGG